MAVHRDENEFACDKVADTFDMKDLIGSKVKSLPQEMTDHPFYIGNLSNVIKRVKLFKSTFPQVQPFYAVKCNIELPLLKLLSSYGCGFDCASKAEMEIILELGVSPDQIIFAHTTKQVSALAYAASKGVQMMTVDCTDELHKIKATHPNAKVVVRIAIEESPGTYQMSFKFGAALDSTKNLLEVAKNLELNVIGVSYHVGCGCSDPKIFYNAVKDARGVFDEADALGFNFTLLDVGGGFPGTEQFNGKFFEIADQINRGLEEFFPASSGVRIIAEPGAFFADSVFALVCKVITVKESTRIVDDNEGRKKEKLFMYYHNESMFGSFNGRPKSLRHPDAEVIKDIEDGTLFPSRLFGITCAPCDYLHEIFMLPKLQSGDYLMYRYFGAYSLTTRSKFNGFGKASVHYIATESSYNDILKRLSANKLDE